MREKKIYITRETRFCIFYYCFVFGALISPTDPIAVLGVLKNIKAPRSLELKIAGEALFNDGMGFANCDRFWSVPKVSNSTIVITGISIENATDIAAYQSVDGRNTVIRMVQNKNTPNISLDFSPSLASHFVVAAIVKGEFYASVLAVSPQNNKVYTATLEKQTPEQFRAKLKAL